MRPYLVILKAEIFALFISPSTYVATFYFLSLLGFGFRFFLESFSFTDWILPPLSSLVIGLLFGSPALIPFITMRSFAEERRLGTLETLMSAPIESFVLVEKDLIIVPLMCILCVAIPFVLVTIAPRFIPAAEVNLFFLLETIIGPIWVWLIIKEQPSIETVQGGVVIIATIAIHSFLKIKNS